MTSSMDLLMYRRRQRTAGGVSGVSEADIVALFAGGKDGALYNPANSSTVFQDRLGAASVIPSGPGDFVGTIQDLSGNGNHAVAPSDDARPILRTGGGLSWLEFDGVDDGLSTPAFTTGDTGATMAVTAELTSAGSFPMMLAHGMSGAGSIILRCVSSSGRPSFIYGVDNTGAGETAAVPAGTTTSLVSAGPSVVAATVDTSNDWAIYQNGVSKHTATHVIGARSGAEPLDVGHRGSSFYWPGDMNALFYIARELTSGERADLESFLAAKGGVAL